MRIVDGSPKVDIELNERRRRSPVSNSPRRTKSEYLNDRGSRLRRRNIRRSINKQTKVLEKYYGKKRVSQIKRKYLKGFGMI